MPLSKYDDLFGGERGAAERTFKNMQRTYGRKGGEHVFYATVAKRRRKNKKSRRLKLR